MLKSIILLIVLALFYLDACKTKKSPDSNLNAVIQTGGDLNFSESQSQYFLNLLVNIQARIGLEDLKESSGNYSGLIHCNQSSGYRTCYLISKNIPIMRDGVNLDDIKTHIEKNFSIGESKIDDVFGRNIWDYIVDTQANIRFNSDIIADITCSILKEKEKADKPNCILKNPRLPDQMKLGENEALTVANLLQGNEDFHQSNGMVNGQINCLWKTNQAECVLSRISDNRQGQKFSLLKRKESFIIFSQLIYLQRYNLPENHSFIPKTIIFSPINCRVDLTSLRENGTYTANCTVTFTE